MLHENAFATKFNSTPLNSDTIYEHQKSITYINKMGYVCSLCVCPAFYLSVYIWYSLLCHHVAVLCPSTRLNK